MSSISGRGIISADCLVVTQSGLFVVGVGIQLYPYYLALQPQNTVA